MRILIATVKVPFVAGGAEAHAEGLKRAFLDAGHLAEIIAIPFKWYPPERIVEQILASRLFDLSEAGGRRVDRLVGLKFPAYLMPHPEKVLWILHQHRQAYDLWQQPLGDLHHYPVGMEVRDAIRRADAELIPKARAVFANSGNVARRLKEYCGIDSTPLYHPPPHADLIHRGRLGDFLYFPSRINPTKRQALVVEALALTRAEVRVRFSGAADEVGYEGQILELARRKGVEDRIEWLGHVTEETKRELYAHCLGVIFPPVDEDYGYVTLEAMLAHKPVITCTDSGGPLEFVEHRHSGLVCDPTPQSLAAAMDELYGSRECAAAWGEAGRARYSDLAISWRNVVDRLLQ